MSENTRLPYLLERIKPGLDEKGYTLERQLAAPEPHSPSSGYVVWLANREDGLPVALKISSYGLIGNYDRDNTEKIKSFFERERDVASEAGKHLNMPDFYEAGEIPYAVVVEGKTWEGSAYFIASQYLQAERIRERVSREAKLSQDEMVMLLQGGLSASGHLHTMFDGNPIIHRDLKPENVYLNGERAYISDFGVAKIGERESGTMIFNLHYPTDVFEGDHPSQDLVALGNVAIAGGFGRDIYSVRSDQNIGTLGQVSVDELLYSDPVKDFLRKLTSDSNERFQTADEALNGLERIIGGNNLPMEVGSSSSSVAKTNGQDAYTFLTAIRDDEDLSEEEKSKKINGYVSKRAGAGDVFLQRVSEGERPEDIVKEAIGKDSWRRLFSKRARQEYREARGGLEGVFEWKNIVSSFYPRDSPRENWYHYNGFFIGGTVGGVLTGLSFLGPTGLAISIPGAILGLSISEHIEQNTFRRKILSQARELDSIFEQYRVFPEENTSVQPAGGLEEEVGLSSWEKLSIRSNSLGLGAILGLGAQVSLALQNLPPNFEERAILTLGVGLGNMCNIFSS